MHPEPIAIIGTAARLPGAHDLAGVAALLRHGIDAVSEIPNGRFQKARWYHPRLGEVDAAIVSLPAQLAIFKVLTRKPSAFPRMK